MERSDPQTGRGPVRRVLIAGGGTAGWMAAAALSRILGKGLDIRLVESEQIGTVGVGEATIPTLVTFHRLLGIPEQEFMTAAQGTIKLGISFEGWRQREHRYIHSFGTTGQDHWSAGFQHFWLRGRERGLAEGYEAYCLESRAAERERFAHLPHNGLNYAYHMDAAGYARFLRGFAEGHGVRRIEGKIAEVRTDPDSGDIASLVLEDGSELAGDLFLDCTGFRALLIGQALRVGFEDWSHWLFNDSAYAAQTTAVRDPVPYTRAIAGEAGWQWRIPLQHRVGNGIVYSSQYIEQAQALEAFTSSLEGELVARPWHLRFRPGRRIRCWHRNCVALGLAGSFIEPLESTTIHLIQRGIMHLLRCFPAVIAQQDIDAYNRQIDAEVEHVRDFVVMHFHLTERRDSAYWNACRLMEIPASLRQRIELFRETGKVFHVPGELFAENSWIQVMLGQGVMPRQHHPAADLMGDEELSRFLGEIRTRVERVLGQLPGHGAYLGSYCPAPKPEPPGPPPRDTAPGRA
ncbi:tryptophan 7-halogenase [Luteimonas sp. RD2P54]|uniref:Tryptophan 7-halogenase n=1 Tax=Luteimonas endophytica TaxID=3042023 RepID=A0ABT6JCG3_9GAMM|nr:tryptophan 7-halogenase [Luteimonas endophytica]MDH5824521.1 tryptophan 7-halogenase [Luteimonas endophytica]